MWGWSQCFGSSGYIHYGFMNIYFFFGHVLAAVVYRVPLTWRQSKQPWKLLHAGLLFLAFVLSVLGLCAVFDYHNAASTPNLYSLHSWLGICTTALFAAQVHLQYKISAFVLH